VLKRLLARYLTAEVSFNLLVLFPFAKNLGVEWLTFDNLIRQHLNRAHGRPKFYCPSCYVTFKRKSDLDSHLRRRPACEIPLEPKFEEKINDEQLTEINKKHPGMNIHDSWNLIFTVLFPQARVPESPCKRWPKRVSTNC
jgi:hypothetical protein